MRRLLFLLIIVINALLLNGCASILLGSKQEVRIESNVEDAKVYFNGRYTGETTPTTLLIKKKNNTIDDKRLKKYELRKDGYESYTYTDRGKAKGAYFVGNIVFWPGFFIDKSKLAQYQFQDAIYGQLEPIEGYVPVASSVLVQNSDNTNSEIITEEPFVELNRRELLKLKFEKKEKENSIITSSTNALTINERLNESLRKTKISNSDLGLDETLKYRRSSLYTLMTHDPSRMHEQVVLDAFGNSELSDNFDEHNIGPYLIKTSAKVKDQTEIITNYLNQKGVARDLVATWFNRQEDGTFDMSLITDRGEYDATVFDANLAQNTARGEAILADAGEELIGKTFVVVHDFNFTNKEEVASKAKKGLAFAGQIAEIAGVDYAETVGALAGEALGIAGKGYVVKTRTYLFRLDWNEEVAHHFYKNHWMQHGKYDAQKAEAFEKSDVYKLRYVGSEVAWGDVQSSTLSGKTNDWLIEKATVKAIDKALVNLQREFEEFRVKTPLVSSEPLKAKIGMKEGLEKGDKFEVLEQVQDEKGRTIYKRKGIITVDKNRIWDNRFAATEDNPDADNDPFTYFKGSGKFYAGMLIRQIN
nr:PEGA domain-containing protein [uncultured Carboxylicivirga sp.]